MSGVFICMLISVGASFIKIPLNCEGCSQATIQMGSIMVVRVIVEFFFAFYQNSISEFYPVSINAIGIGMGGVFGSIGVGISEVVVTSMV